MPKPNREYLISRSETGARGIGLMIRDTGAGDKGFNGAGIWPTVDKAKQIADQAVKRLLDPDCVIAWTEISN